MQRDADGDWPMDQSDQSSPGFASAQPPPDAFASVFAQHHRLVEPPSIAKLKRVESYIKAKAEAGKLYEQEQKDAALARRLSNQRFSDRILIGSSTLQSKSVHAEDLTPFLPLLNPNRSPKYAPVVPAHSESHRWNRLAELVKPPEARNKLNSKFTSKKPSKKKATPKKPKDPKDLLLDQLKPATRAAIFDSPHLPEQIIATTDDNLARNMSNGKVEPHYNLPHQTRSLRACMVCTIVLPQSTFVQSGCPNCESALELTGSPDAVNECTSSNFNGTLALMNPERSWVGKWQRLEGYVPGIYAVQVIGTLPEEVMDSVRSAGMRYVPRDGRKEDEEEADM